MPSRTLITFYAAISLIYRYVTIAADCTWCDFDLSSCDITDDYDWTLVRAVGPSYAKWFPETDHVLGTAAANDNSANLYNIGSFSDAVPSFNQYLFITGDCSTWLIASKSAVNGAFYANELRDICASSESTEPHQARWFNRAGNPEDPWVSTIDHFSAIGAGKIVHGENSFGYIHASTVIPVKNGAYVFIRYAGELDSQGCVEADPSDECAEKGAAFDPFHECSCVTEDECAGKSGGYFCNPIAKVNDDLGGAEGAVSDPCTGDSVCCCHCENFCADGN